jgi:hypothetical protein
MRGGGCEAFEDAGPDGGSARHDERRDADAPPVCETT